MKMLLISRQTREKELPRINELRRKFDEVDKMQWDARSRVLDVSTALDDVAYAAKLIKFTNPSAGKYAFIDVGKDPVKARTAVEYKTLCAELPLKPDLKQDINDIHSALIALDLRSERLQTLEKEADTKIDNLSNLLSEDEGKLFRADLTMRIRFNLETFFRRGFPFKLMGVLGCSAIVGAGLNSAANLKSAVISAVGGAAIGGFYLAVSELQRHLKNMSDFWQMLHHGYEKDLDYAVTGFNQLNNNLGEELGHLTKGLPEMLAMLEGSFAEQARQRSFKTVRDWVASEERQARESRRAELAAQLEQALAGEF